MSDTPVASLHSLRMAYQVAYAIYGSCRRARSELSARGIEISAETLEREAAAGAYLCAARAEFLRALRGEIAKPRKGPRAVGAPPSGENHASRFPIGLARR